MLVHEDKDIKFADLKKITNNFSDEFKVSSDSCGSIYQGVYNGQVIAVKKLHPHEGFDDKAFEREVRYLTNVWHPNVVQVIGYFYKSKHKYLMPNVQRVLCLEYMHGGSLDEHINDESCDLDWATCYKIIRGICEGLNSLHNSRERPIFHLHLEPSRILLDKNLAAKIGGLDFSIIVASSSEIRQQTLFTNRRLEYMSPEYLSSGRISNKFDVYSLGVIILNIMAGNEGYFRYYQLHHQQFTELVINNWKERLQMSGYLLEMNITQVQACVNIARKCLDDDEDRRPSVKDIVDEVKGLESTIQMEIMHMEFDSLESVLGGRESPRHLKLPFLQFITKNFSEELKIGSGGCAVVYKGILRNTIIAVKSLLNSHTIDDKMFHREVKSLMTVNHKNVVQFLGYCSNTEEQALKIEGNLILAQDRERLLCFEYLFNGSLETYVTDELRGLEWQTRYHIIKGICDGLFHLHSENHIVHMDLKPANILLDSNMVPKITDFGISRLDDISQTTSSERLVSLGYCAPEYLIHGKMSAKSDIYSLGVIILVLVTGSKEELSITNKVSCLSIHCYNGSNKQTVVICYFGNLWFRKLYKVHRRWRHRWNKTAKDAQLGYKQVTACLHLAGRCMQRDPKDRPNIWDIISYLNQMDSCYAETSRSTGFMELEDMLGIEPLEIHVPFELNKQLSCSVALTNDTDDQFAFRIWTTSLRPYYIEANEGTVPPRSRCSVTISMQAWKKALPDHLCRDEFCIQSTRMDGSLAATNISADIFNEEAGKVIDTVNFSVVLIEASSPSADH